MDCCLSCCSGLGISRMVYSGFFVLFGVFFKYIYTDNTKGRAIVPISGFFRAFSGMFLY